MDSIKLFNEEMHKYLSTDKSDLAQFLNEKFKQSSRKTYHGFLDDFLLKYGIISFNAVLNDDNDYVPYVSFREENIFNEPKGDMKLSDKGYRILECQRLFAKYFISKFKTLDVNSFKECND